MGFDEGILNSRLQNKSRLYPQILGLVVCTIFLICGLQLSVFTGFLSTTRLPVHATLTLARCRSLGLEAGPPSDFDKRTRSDRFVPGTKPTLIQNAKIWTGADNGTEVVHGDVLLENGLIEVVGRVPRARMKAYGDELVVFDAKGAWVTSGIVDMHSHLGDASSPELAGASYDDNSFKGPVLPWLRSLDGLNTHDQSYKLSIAGGVTTAVILPGSANAIGGQGFTIKLRKTAERTPTSMLLEPPYQINSSHPPHSGPLRWRQMKHACGENPSSVYSATRMDTIWAFRKAYAHADQIKSAQDAYCSKALNGQWDELGEFPEDLQWEALVDVLRGRVKVQTHCYEAVDLDALVRLSNEFHFPIAAFHHASEAFLVPDLLKRAYGKPPAIALFATNARYKREAYRSSEFAPRVLAEHGLKVSMKSDHPVLNSRYLLYEAQQAHFYGLADNLALASVTSTPAEVLGLDHRIGFVKVGWDADIVVWDSHPLALGATPVQVFIDGIAQLESPYVVKKPLAFQKIPKTPNFDKEAADAVKYEGLPPLAPKSAASGTIMFINVKSVFARSGFEVQQSVLTQRNELGVVVVSNGSIACSGSRSSCAAFYNDPVTEVIDLHSGSIGPGLVSFGAPLGLQDIDQEDSTQDGQVYDSMVKPVPKLAASDQGVIRAADGLQYASRDALLAYRAGVTSAITAPTHSSFFSGLSVHFSTGSLHKLDQGALVQDVMALHVAVRHFGRTPSVSTQIATLRRLLLQPGDTSTNKWFKEAAEGRIPLVVEAHGADIIATLILLKKEVENQIGSVMRMSITGAAEAHNLAQELGEASIGVILNPPRPFPYVWEDRRILPGPPLSRESAISKLIAHNVSVGIGIEEIWSARNARFDLAWAALEADGRISKEQAFAIGSTNIERLLGGQVNTQGDLVATEGGDLCEYGSKVVAIISSRRNVVDLL